MKIKLLLSVLALVFTTQSFANDMYAYLRVSLETNNLAMDPIGSRALIREFIESTGSVSTVDAGIGSLKNEKVREALKTINSEIRTLTPYGAQSKLRKALAGDYTRDEVTVQELTDELMASAVAYMMMWENHSRWMVSNAKIICPASYSYEDCALFQNN